MSPDRRAKVPPLLEVASSLSWRFIVVVIAAALVIKAIVELRLVLIPVVIALFLASILAPPVNWLKSRGWPPLLATASILVAGLLTIVSVVALIGPIVGDELGDTTVAIEEGVEEITTWLLDGPLKLSRGEIETYIDRAGEEIGKNTGLIASGVVRGAVAAAEAVAGVLLALVILFFFLKDGASIAAWFRDQFSEDSRHHVSELGERAWNTISVYVRGTAVIALVDSLLIGLALVLIGVPLVIPLMALTFLGGFFPLIGAVLAGLIAALVALVTSGPLDALLVLAAIVVIQQVEGDVLAPLVLGRAVRLHPLAILLSLTAGAIIAGIIGAFLAVPLAAIAATAGNYYKSVREPASA